MQPVAVSFFAVPVIVTGANRSDGFFGGGTGWVIVGGGIWLSGGSDALELGLAPCGAPVIPTPSGPRSAPQPASSAAERPTAHITPSTRIPVKTNNQGQSFQPNS